MVNEWHREWDALPPAEYAARKARQGVRYPVLEALDVLDPETIAPVPADGADARRGDVPRQRRDEGLPQERRGRRSAAFAGGWFHSGDLGVKHPDGYIQLKDRSKDIIISGGENISSIEVEDALYKHPAVQAAAVVAKPDEKWGETPCAFVELKPSEMVSAEELIAWCRQHLAALQDARATWSSPSCRRPRRARSRNSALREMATGPVRPAFRPASVRCAERETAALRA